MYKVVFVVVFLSTCLAMPRFKRNTWRTPPKRVSEEPDTDMMYTLLMNEMYMYLNADPATGMTASDVTRFFEEVIGKDARMADNFGVDYIFWGDQNGDHRLNRTELLRAMKIHKVFEYI
ncbi:uncharacterized protein LOC134721326 [Mytilus trossulus]|uniref:uncharacterized protein LOC134721326 n=1 Tax=Mytilus trossulus TaxID=6551 RepID=UPI003007545E